MLILYYCNVTVTTHHSSYCSSISKIQMYSDPSSCQGFDVIGMSLGPIMAVSGQCLEQKNIRTHVDIDNSSHDQSGYNVSEL